VFKLPVFDYLLLKLAARCNLDCTYCYWFQDSSVYEKPKVLTREVELAVVAKVEEHINRHKLSQFSILFHGGEPLLFGKARMVHLCDDLRRVENATSCKIDLSITTNGVLIDDEWAAVFRYFGISPTLSLDGPKDINDARRQDHVGRGSYEKVVRGLELLRKHEIEPGILAVCDPSSDPDKIASHFIDSLRIRRFDVLVPDATHSSSRRSISGYYRRLFDLWYDDYSHRGVEIRYLRAIMKGLLGGDSHLESIGFGPIQTCAVLTDGSLEPLDVLRIAGYGSTRTNVSILTHTFQDVQDDPVWRRAFEAASNLCQTCKECEYLQACGGGFLPHRWSNDRGYDNPSAYCHDLKEIFDHVWNRMADSIEMVVDGKHRSLAQVVTQTGSEQLSSESPSPIRPSFVIL
jgi:uncharacterized protein